MGTRCGSSPSSQPGSRSSVSPAVRRPPLRHLTAPERVSRRPCFRRQGGLRLAAGLLARWDSFQALCPPWSRAEWPIRGAPCAGACRGGCSQSRPGIPQLHAPLHPPRLSQVPSAKVLPAGCAAGLGLEGAVQAFLGEDRFSRGLGDSTPSSLARTPLQ